VLVVQVIEARALKNRLNAGTIQDIIGAYMGFLEINKKEYFGKIVYECLLNHDKTDTFLSVIDRLHKQQQQLVNVEDALRNAFFDPVNSTLQATTPTLTPKRFDLADGQLAYRLSPYWFVDL
jgi:hypothetical protein